MEDFTESNVVLVVDDDEMNLQVAKMILEKKLPCKVITAESGEKCLKILKAQYVRVVLLDIMMPDMDGIETLKEIRSDPKIKNTQILMLTASLDKDNIKKAAEYGVKDYVRKPFMPNELIDRVAKKLITVTSNKVLAIVDENNFEAWNIILEDNFPHEFIIKTSGLNGIELLRKVDVSLVIISADVKFIEGYRLLDFMASDEKFANVPLIVASPNNLIQMLDKSGASTEEKNHHEERKRIAHIVTTGIGYKFTFKD